MCAVFGFAGAWTEPAQSQVIKVFRESQIRGLHAFGVAWTEGETLHSFKSLKPEAIVNYFRSVEINGTILLLGHCRYCTSGDWTDPKNNQPLISGDTAFAFNGVIRMNEPKDWEQEFGMKFRTSNDGEIFLNKWLQDRKQAVKWVASEPFSFAGLILSGPILYALRNLNRPLYLTRHKLGAWITSTKDIAMRAGLPNESKPLLVNKLHEVGYIS